MPLEPQWKELIKIFIITIILGVIIGVISSVLIWTPGAWMTGAWTWIGYLYLIPTIVFVILIYKWAKKHNYI